MFELFFEESSPPQKPADLYIDLGTANTLIAARGRGLVINEPTLIAYTESIPGHHRKVIAIGFEAKEKLSKTPGNIIAVRPLKEGVIADYKTTEILLRFFIEKLGASSFLRRPRLVISLPYGATEVEKRATIEAGKSAGAKEVSLVDEPMVAAIGVGLPIDEPKGSMILDIGGGTTEVAIIALCDVIHCQAIRVGGHKIDQSIVEYMKKTKNLIIPETTAEQLKIHFGTACPKKDIRITQVQGRDAQSGLTKVLEVSSEDIGNAMDDCLNEIVNAIHITFENTPPELISDIIEDGLTISGGGALIKDIDIRLQNEVRLPVRISSEPLLTIARGGDRLLNDPELLGKIRLES